jgi:hypothetical protein
VGSVDAPAKAEAEEGSLKQPNPSRRYTRYWVAGVILAIVAGFIIPPFLKWQRTNEERALSLSNIRRIGLGALLYSQDWDSNTMPAVQQLSKYDWLTWPKLLQPYVSPDSTFSNPSNPLIPFHSSVRHPIFDYPIDSSYAVNSRLWNTFASGPFPLDNLELPEQTVLFVEAGRMWHNPLRWTMGRNIGVLEYGDTLDRYGVLSPYPSTHDGKMAVVAADGHGLVLTVQHYGPSDGPHNAEYGRIGSGIYNWNGGHPNGETDRPPNE